MIFFNVLTIFFLYWRICYKLVEQKFSYLFFNSVHLSFVLPVFLSCSPKCLKLITT